MSASYDVVVFGASGVTGREVARYLAGRAPEIELRWAVAGRRPERIRATLAEAGVEVPDVLSVDVEDRSAVEAMVEATRVVANLVGPYADYGRPVYEACAAGGTHQLDLTGELDWVAAMIAELGEQAAASGAKIVPSCGFESLPFDLVAARAAHLVHQATGQAVVEVDVAMKVLESPPLRRASDAVSGGTVASGIGAFRRGGLATGDARLLDPPDHEPAGFDLAPRRHAGTGAWLGPLVPSPYLNPPVAHRSAALSRAGGYDIYAPSYRYREGIDVGVGGPVAGLVGPAASLGLDLARRSSELAGRLPGPARSALADVAERLAPSPGDGPRAEDLGRWRYRLDARATGSGGATRDASVEGYGHPGYLSTATMIGEAAVILADPSAPVPDRVGFLTPATALGLGVLDRFARAGLAFTDG